MWQNESIWSAAAAVLIAVTGGVARQFHEQGKTRKKPKTVKQFFKEVFVAFFSGVMMLLLVLATGIAGYWVYLLCGVGGWTSPNILYFITRASEKLLGTEKNELEGKGNGKEK